MHTHTLLHCSLALTLHDSQQIARKLAQLVGCLILFVLVFVWMGIFGKADKSITFASFLVGFAFMIGKLQDIHTYVQTHDIQCYISYINAMPTMKCNEVALDRCIEVCHVPCNALC
jgi:hypothetical protein